MLNSSASTMVFSMKTPSSSPSNSLKHCCIHNSYNHHPSRRLLYFISAQSQVLGANAAKLFGAGRNSIEDSKSENVATAFNEQDALNWVKNDNRRMLHVIYRVGDLEKTIKFYTECLGMKVLRKRDIPEEQYSNAFLGYGPEDSHFAVELTYKYGVDKYDIGNGFGHFGVAVDDVSSFFN
ncbi:probable lactoylglutathione lyase, chloroplastic [Hibiscus syriacus]|uniref:probable lactoylglutathione lyase, chloroplastic n=1 Tax=Hibiscus syriacus TaxID=106335 RepID=UPI0019226D27|nr:probable lactoylglutathione lyase, chloroplastic [Hibiscus syriacus]